ncbi:MAG: hypothetical protein WCK58_18470 [Chloroflexota bacterium]
MTATAFLRRLAATAGMALVALGPLVLPAAVLAHEPDPMLSGGLFAQGQSLPYRWGAGGTPPALMRAAINAAADDSNGSRRSKAPVFGYDAAAGNTIYYGTDVPCGVNGLACFRRSAPDGFGVWLRENGHRYDWGTLRWCEMTGDPDGCYEAETITLDELGHVTGLDHHVNDPDDSDYLDATVQTYSRAKPRDGWNAHVYGRCDVAALQQAYDVLTSATPYSTCLDVPSATSLATLRTSVVAGSVVTFTATVTTSGTGRLYANGVSGRVVVLQQRNGTTWTDVATMTPGTGAGMYGTSLLLRSTTDVRAILRKPVAEGLRASASVAMTVTVTLGCLPDGSLCPLVATGPKP